MDERERDNLTTSAPVAQMRSGTGGTAIAAEAAPLLPEREVTELRSRWDSIQASFVDEPRSAVKQADELVAAAVQRITGVFADERNKLESQWDRGDDVSTEDLRVSLQRYRSFFGRLLSV
jgi:hypothetical protein